MRKMSKIKRELAKLTNEEKLEQMCQILADAIIAQKKLEDEQGIDILAQLEESKKTDIDSIEQVQVPE